MPYADNISKQFGPRSGPTDRQFLSISNPFDAIIVLLKQVFGKANFEKKVSRRQQKHEILPSMQRDKQQCETGLLTRITCLYQLMNKLTTAVKHNLIVYGNREYGDTDTMITILPYDGT